eukprot:GHVU01014966.1.p1 GENE.GHVU01014966.1~~GHVU01014966.1.p1  ORF type:complete len:1694 (+),score=180.04 GHVU01014966.1:626-5083(+)
MRKRWHGGDSPILPHRIDDDDDCIMIGQAAVRMEGSTRPNTGHEETYYVGPQRHHVHKHEWGRNDTEYRQPAQGAPLEDFVFFDKMVAIICIIAVYYGLVLPQQLIRWIPEDILARVFNSVLREIDAERPKRPICMRIHPDVAAVAARLSLHLKNNRELHQQSFWMWAGGLRQPSRRELMEGAELPMAPGPGEEGTLGAEGPRRMVEEADTMRMICPALNASRSKWIYYTDSVTCALLFQCELRSHPPVGTPFYLADALRINTDTFENTRVRVERQCRMEKRKKGAVPVLKLCHVQWIYRKMMMDRLAGSPRLRETKVNKWDPLVTVTEARDEYTKSRDSDMARFLPGIDPKEEKFLPWIVRENGVPEHKPPPKGPEKKAGSMTRGGFVWTEVMEERRGMAPYRENGNIENVDQLSIRRKILTRAYLIRKAALELFRKDCPVCLGDPKAKIYRGKCNVCKVKCHYCPACGTYVGNQEECPVCPEGGAACECGCIGMHGICACSYRHPYCPVDGAWIPGEYCVVCPLLWECPTCEYECIGAYCKHCKTGDSPCLNCGGEISYPNEGKDTKALCLGCDWIPPPCEDCKAALSGAQCLVCDAFTEIVGVKKWGVWRKCDGCKEQTFGISCKCGTIGVPCPDCQEFTLGIVPETRGMVKCSSCSKIVCRCDDCKALQLAGDECDIGNCSNRGIVKEELDEWEPLRRELKPPAFLESEEIKECMEMELELLQGPISPGRTPSHWNEKDKAAWAKNVDEGQGAQVEDAELSLRERLDSALPDLMPGARTDKHDAKRRGSDISMRGPAERPTGPCGYPTASRDQSMGPREQERGGQAPSSQRPQYASSGSVAGHRPGKEDHLCWRDAPKSPPPRPKWMYGIHIGVAGYAKETYDEKCYIHKTTGYVLKPGTTVQWHNFTGAPKGGDPNAYQARCAIPLSWIDFSKKTAAGEPMINKQRWTGDLNAHFIKGNFMDWKMTGAGCSYGNTLCRRYTEMRYRQRSNASAEHIFYQWRGIFEVVARTKCLDVLKEACPEIWDPYQGAAMKTWVQSFMPPLLKFISPLNWQESSHQNFSNLEWPDIMLVLITAIYENSKAFDDSVKKALIQQEAVVLTARRKVLNARDPDDAVIPFPCPIKQHLKPPAIATGGATAMVRTGEAGKKLTGRKVDSELEEGEVEVLPSEEIDLTGEGESGQCGQTSDTRKSGEGSTSTEQKDDSTTTATKSRTDEISGPDVVVAAAELGLAPNDMESPTDKPADNGMREQPPGPTEDTTKAVATGEEPGRLEEGLSDEVMDDLRSNCGDDTRMLDKKKEEARLRKVKGPWSDADWASITKDHKRPNLEIKMEDAEEEDDDEEDDDDDEFTEPFHNPQLALRWGNPLTDTDETHTNVALDAVMEDTGAQNESDVIMGIPQAEETTTKAVETPSPMWDQLGGNENMTAHGISGSSCGSTEKAATGIDYFAPFANCDHLRGFHLLWVLVMFERPPLVAAGAVS